MENINIFESYYYLDNIVNVKILSLNLFSKTKGQVAQITKHILCCVTLLVFSLADSFD